MVEALLRFLKEYETVLYLVLGGGAFISLRALISAWNEWRLAVFGLEKELIFQRIRLWGSFFILVVLIGLSQFCLVSFVAPYLPASALLATPTLSLTAPSGMPAPTMPPDGKGTASPAPPPGSVGCLPNQFLFTFPQPGEQVKGKVAPRVTVNFSDLGFFKYEYAPAGSDDWRTIAADNQIRIDYELNPWDTTALTPGDYQLRLVATNNLGETLPPCVIPVRVLAP